MLLPHMHTLDQETHRCSLGQDIPLNDVRGGELLCCAMQAPPAENPSVAAEPSGQQAGAKKAGTALQDPAGVSSSEAEPLVAQDDGAAHNGSMRGERKHVRKREEPAGVFRKPLISLDFM